MIETLFHLDYEFASEADLEIVGLANILDNPTTRVLMCAYAENDHKPKLWEPHKNPDPPAELREALEDPWVTAVAWNAAVERGVSKKILGIDKPIEEWRDTMASARYMSLPGKLIEAGKILGLGEDEAKIKAGSNLISKFCFPAVPAQEGMFGHTAAGFCDWNTDPADWELFGEYCKQDVVAERTIEKILSKYPMPQHEWETWYLDQKINETGWPVDLSVVKGAAKIIEIEMARLSKRLIEVTGLKNPNSVDQLLPWLQTHGYRFDSVNKVYVARALNGECELSEKAREALTIRGQTSKASIKKYAVVGSLVSPDGRLRHQYTFMGAARTGRWAAHGANVGNLPKPDKKVEKRLELAVELVQKVDYEAIVKEFGNPLEVVSSTIRPSFRAPEGHKLLVSDLKAIENILLAYICRCKAIRDVFEQGKDPYLDFATRLYKQPYEELLAEYNAGDKTKRTIAKPAVLGAGYRLRAGEETIDENGTKSWTGLMAYARAMGIELSKEDADLSVSVFRESYPEVVWAWRDFERSAFRAVRNPGKIFGVGIPNSETEEERFREKGRPIYSEAIVSFKCHSDKVLEMLLPSGRSLHYLNPRIEESSWSTKDNKRMEITYDGKLMNKPIWGRVSTAGHKFLENADQAIARDILVNGMKAIDKAGIEIAGHTYDEIVGIVPLSSPFKEGDIERCMSIVPDWMKDKTLPLQAAAYSDVIYRKD
jgi:DNA polymerase